MKIQNTFHRHRRNRSLGTLAVIASLSILAAASAQAALTVHYTFDNADIIGAAAQNDQTANNNDSGEPTGFTTGVAGQYGEAYNFDKTGYVAIGWGVVPSGQAARTISLWFNQDVEVSGKKNIIFGYGGTNPGQSIQPGIEGGVITMRHYGGAVTFGPSFDFDGTDAGWHHLAVRVNSSASTYADVDVFLDGTLLSASGATSQSLNTTVSEFRIGGTTTFGNADWFDGSVDELKIFDADLTNADIASLAGVPEPSAALLGGLGALLLLRRRRI